MLNAMGLSVGGRTERRDMVYLRKSSMGVATGCSAVGPLHSDSDKTTATAIPKSHTLLICPVALAPTHSGSKS